MCLTTIVSIVKTRGQWCVDFLFQLWDQNYFRDKGCLSILMSSMEHIAWPIIGVQYICITWADEHMGAGRLAKATFLNIPAFTYYFYNFLNSDKKSIKLCLSKKHMSCVYKMPKQLRAKYVPLSSLEFLLVFLWKPVASLPSKGCREALPLLRKALSVSGYIQLLEDRRQTASPWHSVYLNTDSLELAFNIPHRSHFFSCPIPLPAPLWVTLQPLSSHHSAPTQGCSFYLRRWYGFIFLILIFFKYQTVLHSLYTEIKQKFKGLNTMIP